MPRRAAARQMQPRWAMKKVLALVVVVTLAGSLSAGCLVSRHGHVAMFPPPALLVAGVIAATAMRPGYVWVDGHWDWVDGRWMWSEGMWIGDRPGMIWIQGGWFVSGERYHWRPGHWRRR
jgi:hypothetical protein